MKKILLLTLIAFLISIKESQAGQILGWEVGIEYPIARFARKFSLYFQLENPLPSTGYIEVRFPLSLGMYPTPTGKLYSLADKVQIGKKPNGLTLATSPLTYFYNFGVDLAPNLWYGLDVVLQDNDALALQTENFTGIIEMYTVSAVDDYRIIYDMNAQFQIFVLGPKPPVDGLSIQLDFSIDDWPEESASKRLEVGSKYIVRRLFNF